MYFYHVCIERLEKNGEEFLFQKNIASKGRILTLLFELKVYIASSLVTGRQCACGRGRSLHIDLTTGGAISLGLCLLSSFPGNRREERAALEENAL